MCDKRRDQNVPRGYSDLPAGQGRGYSERETEDFANEMPMRPMNDSEILARLFSPQPPNEITIPKFTAINQAAKNFAEVVLQTCPPSADRTDAIREIRKARMTANQAVALNGLTLY